MRVLMVVPTSAYGTAFPAILSVTYFPVGFAYLASALRAAGHEVHGVNPNNHPEHRTAHEMLRGILSAGLGKFQPELIALGGLCTDYLFLKDAIRLCRKMAPNVPIVIGGGIVTNDGPFVFDLLRPDFCVFGEGEETLVRLVRLLESGDRDFGKIPNLGYWKDGRANFSEQSYDYPDIDTRPFPDYEPFGIDDMLDHYSFGAARLYRYTRVEPRPMTIVTARSCPFNCTFCVHQRGPRYRARSIGNIMREMERLFERYRFNILIIQDELFAVNRPRLREFCEAVIDRRRSLGWDFDWLFQTHASASLTFEDLKLAREAGCYFFSYGLESASPRVLSSMNKKTKPSQIIEAVRRAHEAKIGFGGNFIFGDIAETTETIAETLTFLRRYLRDDYVTLIAIQPYPGSKLFEYCLERGIVRDKKEFYECNGKGYFNMTSLPDPLLLSFYRTISAMNSSQEWLRTVPAGSCSRETDREAYPMGSRLGLSVFRVSAKCPHCGGDVLTLEPLEDSGEGGGARRFLSTALSVYRNGRHNPLTFFKREVLPYLEQNGLLRSYVKRHEVFRLLDDLADQEGSARRVFATGCPHCNRWFRIKIGDA